MKSEFLKKGELPVFVILFGFLEFSFLGAMFVQVSICLELSELTFSDGEDSVLHGFRIHFCIE